MNEVTAIAELKALILNFHLALRGELRKLKKGIASEEQFVLHVLRLSDKLLAESKKVGMQEE